ncbi:MFS transporter [Pediococcus siamensis]|uniref:MFS transporter n=1 Tax=Pediococcus siamensis TaxID=381829 RepID=UPI0039A11064
MKKRDQWLLLLATSLVNFMSTIDASIVTIAVPQLSHDLRVPMNEAEWVVSVYLVLICVLLVFFGSLADQIGKIKIFQLGTLIFTVGSLGCGLSTTLGIMLIARILQALGAAMALATNFAIITQLFPLNKRGLALGVNSAFGQIGNIMGPGLGGLLLATLSWHAIFFINVPLGIVIYLFGHRVFPKEIRQTAAVKMDFKGFVVYAAMIVSFFVGVYWGQAIGFNQIRILGLFLLALFCGVLFVWREYHTEKPLINLKIFKNRGFSIGVLTTILIFAVGYFNNMILPFYLQETLHFSAAISGLILMATPLLNVVSAPLGGTLGDRIGSERISFYALFLFILPELIFCLIQPAWGISWLLVALMTFGFANGTFQNNPMIMSNAEAQYQGIAGSLAALARNLGMAIGLSLATSVLYLGISQKAGRHMTSYPTHHARWFVEGMHLSYGVSFSLLLLSMGLLGWLLASRKHTFSK